MSTNSPTSANRRGVLCALTLTGALCAVSTQAQVLGPAAVGDLVTLHDAEGSAFWSGSCEWTRLMYSGERLPFTLPPNRVLVITSLQWIHRGPAPLRHRLELFRDTGNLHDPTFELLAVVPALDSPFGTLGGSATFPTGIVVAPGRPYGLCWQVSGNPHSVRVTLQGYLVSVPRRDF